MNSGETVTYCRLEWLFLCVDIAIQTVCAQCLWWESWIWHDTSHIFPQGVLAAITLVGGGAGDGGAKAGTGCEAGLPLCSVAITTLSGVGSDPKLALFPWSVCFPLSQHQDTCSTAKECWNKRGSGSLSACVSHRQRAKISPVCCLCRCPQLFPWLCSEEDLGSVRCKSLLTLRAHHCPQPLLPMPCCGEASQGRLGLPGLSEYIRAETVVEGLLPEFWAASNALLEQLPTVATATPARLCPRTRSPLCPQPSLLFGRGCPTFGAMLWHRVSGASVCSARAGVHEEVYTQVMPGSHPRDAWQSLGQTSIRECFKSHYTSLGTIYPFQLLLFVQIATRKFDKVSVLL